MYLCYNIGFLQLKTKFIYNYVNLKETFIKKIQFLLLFKCMSYVLLILTKKIVCNEFMKDILTIK